MLAALATPHRIKQSHRRRRTIASGALDYNYFRDYEPATGRYVESDPIGLNGGISTYSYARGNSLRKRDAKGLLYTDAGGDAQNWVIYWNFKILELLNTQCDCGTSGCFPCDLKPQLLAALFTTKVTFQSTDWDGPGPGEIEPTKVCGVTSIDRTSMSIAPGTQASGHAGGYCGLCATAVIFHELLHAAGLNHTSNQHNDPNDPVWGPGQACAGKLCYSGGPMH